MQAFRTAAFSAACALFLAATCIAAESAGAVAAGQGRVERFLEGLESLQAQFEQQLTNRSGELIEQSSGSLAIRRPDRFRWDYRDPYEQIIVADGERIWLYDRDLEQVTVRKLDETLSATPAMLLSGAGAIEDNFTVVQSQREGRIDWVRMEPKRDDTDFKWVRLGFEGDDLRYMELGDKLGQTTRLTFNELERNPPLDPALFTFTVPPGVDVIGDSSGGQR